MHSQALDLRYRYRRARVARLGVQLPEQSGGLAVSTGPGARGMREVWIRLRAGERPVLSASMRCFGAGG